MKLDLTFLFGLIVILGGIIGYAKAGSLPSLIGGWISGLLLVGLRFVRKPILKKRLTLLVLFLLVAFFAYRFAVTYKFFPSGLFGVLGAVLILYEIQKSKR